ncbi:MAG: AAA family ATPase [Coriobacteriales bacterium]|nr:AAA family ATPase [Coriobacteriales bacterium]
MTQVPFIRRVSIDWDAVPDDSFVRSIGALRSLPLDFAPGVTFMVGENATGKSTLLEAIAVAYGLNPEGGSRNYAFSTRDTHSGLHEAVHLVRGPMQPRGAFFLRAESFYNVATASEEYDRWYWGKTRQLHTLSHGEAFLAVIQKDFRENGLYILDEPEAAFSVSRQLTLLYEFDRLAKHGAQLIVATHSPVIMALPGARILAFDEREIREVAYEETEAYQTMDLFMRDRERLLERLLEGE